jgi:DNA-binding NarL/FixJ family response regulator
MWMAENLISLRTTGDVSLQNDAATATAESAQAEAWNSRSGDAATKKGVKRRKILQVALIDQRPLIREALGYRLKMIRRDCRIAPFPTASEFLADFAVHDGVELVILSIGSAAVASGGTLETIRQLRSSLPSKPIIVVSDENQADSIATAIRCGARGYIPTSLDLQVAMAALEVVLAGGTFAPATTLFNGAISNDHYAPMRQPDRGATNDLDNARSAVFEHSVRAPAEPPGVTARETEVLTHLVQGKSNKVIARELNMREGTVKVHLRNMMKKLDAANRTQLALRAHRTLGYECS